MVFKNHKIYVELLVNLAQSLKRLLAASRAELGVIVSEYVSRSLVCRYPSLVNPGAFRTIRFQSKSTRARAWTYLPDAPA
jgi:hypothetical protein